MNQLKVIGIVLSLIFASISMSLQSVQAETISIKSTITQQIDSNWSYIIEPYNSEVAKLTIKGNGALTSDIVDKANIILGTYNDTYDIISLQLSEGITSVEKNACSEMFSLTSLMLPDSLTKIKDEAFARAQLNQIVINKNVSYISPTAFMHTGTEFVVSNDNPYYTSIDGVLFTKDKKTLVDFPSNKELDGYLVPLGTQTIWSDAFIDWNFLNNFDYSVYIVIPGTVKNIIYNNGAIEAFRDHFGSTINCWLDCMPYKEFTIVCKWNSAAYQHIINSNNMYYEASKPSDTNIILWSRIPTGDIIEDGIIDSNDALSLLNYVVGNYDIEHEFMKYIADVDDDGKITAADALMILNAVVGNIQLEPSAKG